MNTTRSSFAKSFGVAVFVAAPWWAHGQSAGQHVDANPYASNGKLAVGVYDFDSQSFLPQIDYLVEPLERVLPGLHGVSAPGFYTTDGRLLLPNAPLSFDIPAVSGPVSPDRSRNALFWDGEGDVAFGDLPEGHTFWVNVSSIAAIADGGTSDIDGFVLKNIGANGFLHEHVGFSARVGGDTQPEEGLYLLPMTLSQPGLETSDVFYLLFNGKYARDGAGNIIIDGFFPRADPVAEGLATDWLDMIFANLEGDFDASGSVEQGDLDLVLTNWGAPRVGFANDGGFASANVDQEELDAVLTNWGSSAVPSFAGAAVPEPATGLAALGAVVALRRRRR